MCHGDRMNEDLKDLALPPGWVAHCLPPSPFGPCPVQVRRLWPGLLQQPHSWPSASNCQPHAGHQNAIRQIKDFHHSCFKASPAKRACLFRGLSFSLGSTSLHSVKMIETPFSLIPHTNSTHWIQSHLLSEVFPVLTHPSSSKGPLSSWATPVKVQHTL